MRSYYILLLFLLSMGITELCFSQDEAIENSVFNLYIDFARSTTMEQKIENSEMFSDALESALAKDVKGEFPFDSLQKYKVMILSADKRVRVFTWDLEAEDGTHTFYGFVHVYAKKYKKYEAYKLNDKSLGMKDPQNAILDNTKWFGAYYYDIVTVKHKKKKYYVLLGWDGLGCA